MTERIYLIYNDLDIGTVDNLYDLYCYLVHGDYHPCEYPLNHHVVSIPADGTETMRSILDHCKSNGYVYNEAAETLSVPVDSQSTVLDITGRYIGMVYDVTTCMAANGVLSRSIRHIDVYMRCTDEKDRDMLYRGYILWCMENGVRNPSGYEDFMYAIDTS